MCFVFMKTELSFHYIFVTKHCWSFCDLQHHKRNELVVRSLPGNKTKIQEKLQWSALNKLDTTKHTQMTQMCHNQNLHTHTV